MGDELLEAAIPAADPEDKPVSLGEFDQHLPRPVEVDAGGQSVERHERSMGVDEIGEDAIHRVGLYGVVRVQIRRGRGLGREWDGKKGDVFEEKAST